MVMTAYTKHGKTSLAKRNSGRKPKLSERDSRILNTTVSKNHRTTAAKVTAELNINLEDPASTTTVRQELQVYNIHRITANANPLISENNAGRRK